MKLEKYVNFIKNNTESKHLKGYYNRVLGLYFVNDKGDVFSYRKR